MMTDAMITDQDNELVVSGNLNFASVVDLWQKSLPMISAKKELVFNLSHVSSANSAALALLIEWIKYAKKNSKQIRFLHIPPQLLAIASVAEINREDFSFV